MLALAIILANVLSVFAASSLANLRHHRHDDHEPVRTIYHLKRKTFSRLRTDAVIDGSSVAPAAMALVTNVSKTTPTNDTKTQPTAQTNDTRTKPDLFLRPHIGDMPEVINFGVFCKQFYGMQLKQGTFSADMVINLKWVDTRAVSLVPDGVSSITLPQESAASQMWMPDIAVTNRDLRGIDVISTAVTVSRAGDVTKVQRLVAVVKNPYDVSMFPYDQQTLKVTLASTSLMSEELTLAPSAEMSGVKDGIFDGAFIFKQSEAVSFEEIDGALKKSRGQMKMVIQRKSASHFEGMLLPELLLALIIYTVFWFPLTAPFIMPRVATCMISYLALVTFMFRTSSMLPTSDSACWVCVFEENTQSLMFGAFLINVVLIVIRHDMDIEELARKLQRETRVAYPVLGAFTYIMVFSIPNAGWLTAVKWMCRVVLFVCFMGFSVVGFIRTTGEWKKQKNQTTEPGGLSLSRTVSTDVSQKSP